MLTRMKTKFKTIKLLRDIINSRWKDEKWLSDTVFKTSLIALILSVSFIYISEAKNDADQGRFAQAVQEAYLDTTAADFVIMKSIPSISESKLELFSGRAVNAYKSILGDESTKATATLQQYVDTVVSPSATDKRNEIWEGREKLRNSTKWFYNIFLFFTVLTQLLTIVFAQRLSNLSRTKKQA